MRAYKKEVNGNLTTYFYIYNYLKFEIDTIDGKSFSIGKVNNSYWQNVVDNTTAKTKQTLIHRLLKGIYS